MNKFWDKSWNQNLSGKCELQVSANFHKAACLLRLKQLVTTIIIEAIKIEKLDTIIVNDSVIGDPWSYVTLKNYCRISSFVVINLPHDALVHHENC